MSVLWLKWISKDDVHNKDLEHFSILRYKPNSQIPCAFLQPTSSFTSITRTSEELSIVCPSSMIKGLHNDESYHSIESDYICFKGK